MRTIIAGGVLAAFLLLPAGAQASCIAPQPPSLRLQQADGAFSGTVLSRSDSTIRLRVDRAVKGDLGPEIELANPTTSVQLGARPGDRIGLFLYRDAQGYASNDCLTIDPDDLLAAAVEPPCRPGARPAVRPRRQAYVRVLGCARPPEGAGFQVLATRRAGQRPCLRLVVLPNRFVRRCADAALRRGQSIDVDGIAGRTIYGTVDGATQGVALRYRMPDGSEGRRLAGLVPIAGARAMRRFDLKRPVQQYAVHLPDGATPLRVERRFGRGRATESVPLER